jgi:hypothetical protein
VASWLVWHFLQPHFGSAGTMLRLLMIAVAGCVSGGIFLAIATLLQLGESRQIINTVVDLAPGRSRRDSP